MKPEFGDIYMSNLTSSEHGIQGGFRPVLVVQNTIAGDTVEILPLTSKIKALHIPTHVVILPTKDNGLATESMVLAEQAVTINTSKLVRRIGTMCRPDLVRVGKARYEQSHFPIS